MERNRPEERITRRALLDERDHGGSWGRGIRKNGGEVMVKHLAKQSGGSVNPGESVMSGTNVPET
ncbi:UNVERIFIED_CONTAM: hypothetical protein Sangu_2470200 [Sesamum angustifolium]|uniref:Uncharacterized protein n=1 Tax=Sesamum angustifolium TaxID=2727405 RepID=A0AAW2IX12_9LAMI